jgi:Transposase
LSGSVRNYPDDQESCTRLTRTPGFDPLARTDQSLAMSGSVKGVEKMGKTGRLYSPEFKEEAIRLVHSSEERYPVAKIARDLDVSAETLR